MLTFGVRHIHAHTVSMVTYSFECDPSLLCVDLLTTVKCSRGMVTVKMVAMDTSIIVVGVFL